LELIGKGYVWVPSGDSHFPQPEIGVGFDGNVAVNAETIMAKDISPKTHFRGYAIPGPTVPGWPDDPMLAIAEGETLDVLCGHFRIFQLRKGHRYSTDDILTAWYGTSWCPSARTILDLGSGLGTVAMVAAWRLPAAQVVTVEAQSESLALARKSVRWNGLEDRFDIREGDLREASVLRREERFDLVLGSPPYFPLGSGVEGDHPQKVACRFEVRGTIADYCQAAAAHLQTGGIFACVFPVTPVEQAERVVAAAGAANLTIVRQRPIVLREGELHLLGVFVMMRQEDLPDSMHGETWYEPPLIIRREDGSIHPEYAAVKLSFGFPP
jgi:tRNA1Val (adenine37-N6)-methyltransferase